MTCFILLSFLLFSGFSYNSPGGGMMDSCYTTDGNDQGREIYYRHIPKCKVPTKDTFPKQLYPSQSHYLIGFLSGTYPFLSLHSWNCVVEDRSVLMGFLRVIIRQPIAWGVFLAFSDLKKLTRRKGERGERRPALCLAVSQWRCWALLPPLYCSDCTYGTRNLGYVVLFFSSARET